MSRPSLTDLRETAVGAAVLAALGVLFTLNALDSGQDERVNGYTLTASFQRADGVALGAPVRMAGIPVGEVVAHGLAGGYRAELTLRLNTGVEVPADSAAVVETDGLLGPKYIEIHPGGEDLLLKPGGRFDYTQDAMVLEDLLARIVEQARDRARQRTAPSATPPDQDPALLKDQPTRDLPPRELNGDEGDRVLERLPLDQLEQQPNPVPPTDVSPGAAPGSPGAAPDGTSGGAPGGTPDGTGATPAPTNQRTGVSPASPLPVSFQRPNDQGQ